MLLQPRQLAPLVPYTFPPISFLKLQDYITNLVNQYGGVYWPLDDVAGNSYNRVINTAVATGRELVIAGDMSDATKWVVGTNWSVSGGVATASSVTTAQLLSQVILQVGRAYTVTYTVVVTSGTVSFNLGSTTVSTGRSASGTYTEKLVCSGNTTFSFRATSGTFSGTIDNVSVKELNIPAYNATPTQLLNTDVWNGLGVGAWTAVNSATVTAPTVTRHDGASGTVIRIARNGVSTPCASQTILDTTKVQRVYGWCHSVDGLAIPIIRHGTTTIFTGTASTDWQPYDLPPLIPTATDFQLGSSTNTGTQSVEFDVTVVALDTGIRTDNPIVNSTFSADVSWLKGSGCTIAGGVGVMTSVAAGAGFSQVSALVIGKRYLITYDLVVTSGTARVLAGSSGTGTTRSVSGTYSEVLICSGSGTLLLAAVATFTGTVDNVVVTELSPLVAVPVNGAVLGNAESNRLLESASFDGVNDFINLYSAQLNSVFNPSEGTFSAFFEVSASGIWTDGVGRYLAHLQVDSTNRIILQRSSTNNTISISYGTTSLKTTTSTAAGGNVGWVHIAVAWSVSADQAILYLNGVQAGSIITTIGTWVGNLSSANATFCAQSSGAAFPWSGRATQPLLLSHALSASEVSEISKLGDAS